MVKSCLNWIPSYLALIIFRLRRYFFTVIRILLEHTISWSVYELLGLRLKPICRHGFCTNTLDVYLIYQSVITILKVVFIPETKKHCYRDYFQKISIYPMVWSASTIRIFVSTKFQPRLCILTVIHYWCGI